MFTREDPLRSYEPFISPLSPRWIWLAASLSVAGPIISHGAQVPDLKSPQYRSKGEERSEDVPGTGAKIAHHPYVERSAATSSLR
jgi:hypothetical protein